MLSRDRDRCVTLGELSLTECDTLRLSVTLTCLSWPGNNAYTRLRYLFSTLSANLTKFGRYFASIIHSKLPTIRRVTGCEFKVQESHSCDCLWVPPLSPPRHKNHQKFLRASPLAHGKLGPVPGRGHICRPNFLPLIDLSWQLADKLKQSTSYI